MQPRRGHPPQGVENRPALTELAQPSSVRSEKAGEIEEEGGGEMGKERRTKVFTFLVCSCSPLLMGDVFYRERSATAVDSAPLPEICLL